MNILRCTLFAILLALVLGVGCAPSPRLLPKDIPSLKALAEKGDADAQLNLGVMYAFGEGVEMDDKEAFKWFRKAAEQNEVGAQYNLGMIYENGLGVEKDDKEAVRWYRKAAEQGDEDAKAALKKLSP